MTYDLYFLPEVEEDVIAGYSWYKDKARDPRTIRLKLSDRDK
jgi:hypothetical protein